MRCLELSILLLLVLAAPPARAATGIGMLAFVSGTATLDGRPAKDGDKVKPGSVIETKKGKCALLFGKDRVVHLDADTHFVVTEYGVKKAGDEAVFDIEQGQVRALVKNGGNKPQKFQFRTKTAVMGVRGTHVFLHAQKDSPTRFVTIEGTATVEVRTAGGSTASNIVTLKQGDSMTVSSSGAPSIQTKLTSSETSKVASTGSAPGTSKTESDLSSTESSSSSSEHGETEQGTPAEEILDDSMPPLDPLLDVGGGKVHLKVRFGK